MSEPNFGKYLSSYFLKYIPTKTDYRENTIKSYRDTFTIFLRYSNDILKIKPHNLKFSDLSKDSIETFLVWLEEEKNSSVRTRNQRLAALQAYFRYIQIEAPEYIEISNAILSIKSKKAPTAEINYLSIDAIKILLAVPNSKTKEGKRDLALLSMLYDTGARVQEIIDLKVSDLRLTSPTTVKLTGKGQKTRIVPIMPQNFKIIKAYLDIYQLTEDDYLKSPLFFNKQGKKLTRAGVTYILKKYFEKARMDNPKLFPSKISPHCLRHSKSMHLLEGNVNLIYIRDFLGHVSVSTTEIYAKSNPEIKRKAIEGASVGIIPNEILNSKEKESLLDFLKELI